MHRATGCMAQIPLALCKAVGREVPATLLRLRNPWMLSDLAVVPVGSCQALHHQRDQDLQTAPRMPTDLISLFQGR